MRFHAPVPNRDFFQTVLLKFETNFRSVQLCTVQFPFSHVGTLMIFSKKDELENHHAPQRKTHTRKA